MTALLAGDPRVAQDHAAARPAAAGRGPGRGLAHLGDDAQRTAVSKQPLAGRLHLQWVRQWPRLTTAWPDQTQMTFDRAYEPVVKGSTMFVGSPRSDTLTALDTRPGRSSGRTRPMARSASPRWSGKTSVYFVSDDGYLYCLDAADGRLDWKFRGGPADRRVLGNARLISTWPAAARR